MQDFFSRFSFFLKNKIVWGIVGIIMITALLSGSHSSKTVKKEDLWNFPTLAPITMNTPQPSQSPIKENVAGVSTIRRVTIKPTNKPANTSAPQRQTSSSTSSGSSSPSSSSNTSSNTSAATATTAPIVNTTAPKTPTAVPPTQVPPTNPPPTSNPIHDQVYAELTGYAQGTPRPTRPPTPTPQPSQ